MRLSSHGYDCDYDDDDDGAGDDGAGGVLRWGGSVTALPCPHG